MIPSQRLRWLDRNYLFLTACFELIVEVFRANQVLAAVALETLSSCRQGGYCPISTLSTQSIGRPLSRETTFGSDLPCSARDR